ncbi:MAG: hypothetical protein IIA82_09110 [Thaumarchaeota archaeon]|nr:hypothetical protein [Nitrososphaerota archaeon]
MGTNWYDLDRDGRKLARLIRFLETKMMKCRSDEKIIRYANTIGTLISKKAEICKFRYSVDDLLKELKIRKSKYEKQKRFGRFRK